MVSRWPSRDLRDRWRSADKSETKETFTIVATERSKVAAQFHNCMPRILEPRTWEAWLKGEPNVAVALMKPANEDALVSRLVSKAAGNMKNNRPELLQLVIQRTTHLHATEQSPPITQKART